MPIQFIPRNEQASGQFNGGAILENKPIGFPGEGGYIKPYSNLFYWAHAWSDEGSLIGEHPHQGFEIMSFVMEGDIDHYDSHYKAWKKLEVGDAQIIRAGKGISHAERMNAGSHMFQIWIDPNLRTTLNQPASYDDYQAATFPVNSHPGFQEKVYRGTDGPMEMDTPGIEIKEWTFEAGDHSVSLNDSLMYSIYIWKGNPTVNGQELNAHDFFIVQDESSLEATTAERDRLFVIASLPKLEYSTYAQMRGR